VDINVEFVGGPYDGRRADLPAGHDGRPPLLRAVTTDPVYDSWLDTAPAHPPEVHRYDRGEPAGDAWRYHHRGRFEQP
jgi:hypothetical protein